MVSQAFCDSMGITTRPDPMAFALFGVKGYRFQTVGLASFTVQLGEPGNGVRFDIVDARLTDDKSKTFILGMDVMSGCVEGGKRTMFPWVLDLAGRLRMEFRLKGPCDSMDFPMRVLEENTYNPSWDAGHKKKPAPATLPA